MSDYAKNFVMDEETGKPKLIKRLNKTRIDRKTGAKPPGGWNKTGKKIRIKEPSRPKRNKEQEEEQLKWKGIDIKIKK